MDTSHSASFDSDNNNNNNNDNDNEYEALVVPAKSNNEINVPINNSRRCCCHNYGILLRRLSTLLLIFLLCGLGYIFIYDRHSSRIRESSSSTSPSSGTVNDHNNNDNYNKSSSTTTPTTTATTNNNNTSVATGAPILLDNTTTSDNDKPTDVLLPSFNDKKNNDDDDDVEEEEEENTTQGIISSSSLSSLSSNSSSNGAPKIEAASSSVSPNNDGPTNMYKAPSTTTRSSTSSPTTSLSFSRPTTKADPTTDEPIILVPSESNDSNNDNNSNEFDELISLENRKRQQIENYKNGTGLLLNIHPVHHGGTTFCAVIGRNGNKYRNDVAPNFACLKDNENIMPNGTSYNKKYLENTPFPNNQVESNIHDIRKYFHMISWEYNGVNKMKRSFQDTQLGSHLQLVSVVVTRDPMSRLLSDGGSTKRKYPGYNKGYLSHNGFWKMAATDHYYGTDNFFLRIIGYYKQQQQQKNNRNKNKKRKLKEDTNIENAMKREKAHEIIVPKSVEEMLELYPSNIEKEQYDHAVSILNQFTIVLDIECFDDGLKELAKLLGLNTTIINQVINEKAKKRKKTNSHHPSKGKNLTSQERIGYDDVYEYLLQKNKWDIQLYEYSKSISLVRC